MDNEELNETETAEDAKTADGVLVKKLTLDPIEELAAEAGLNVDPKIGRPKKADSEAGNEAGKSKLQSKRAAFVEKVRPKFQRFCIALASGARTREALVISDVGWGEIQHGMNHSAELKALYEDAQKIRSQRKKEDLEEEVYHRAVHGHKEPMVSAGKHVCDKIVRSDRLIELLYRANHPELFVQRTESNVNITARTVGDLIEQIEDKTPIGATAPCVFIGEAKVEPEPEDAEAKAEDESQDVKPPSGEE